MGGTQRRMIRLAETVRLLGLIMPFDFSIGFAAAQFPPCWIYQGAMSGKVGRIFNGQNFVVISKWEVISFPQERRLPMTKYKSGEWTKQQIIDATFRLIADKGYDDMSIEDIMNESGKNEGGVLFPFSEAKRTCCTN